MGNRVSLFVTALSTSFSPRSASIWPDVLERLGYEIDFPESQTCRAAAFNSGYRDEARTVARHFLDTFESSECIGAFRLLHVDGDASLRRAFPEGAGDARARPFP